jgi:TolB-like protein
MAALGRMLDSEELRTSPRSRAFLSYVVTETLAGRAERLTGRTVARYALGRTEDFDGATDASARVQAGRLRERMGRFYAGSGATEVLRIELPVGSYVPTFTSGQGPSGVAGAGLEPSLVIVRFTTLGGSESGDPALSALALTESLVHALSPFPGLRVIGPVGGEQGVLAALRDGGAAPGLGTRYVLTGSVRTTEVLLRVTIRLSEGATGQVLWSDVYDQQRSAVTGFHDEDDLVRRIAGTVADFRGVIHRDSTQRASGTQISAAYAATLSYYRHLDSGTPADTRTAARDLRLALEVDPHNVVLLSMLGSLEYMTAILHWTPDPDVALAEAERLARTALTLRPGHAHAWLVLAGVALARGRTDQCQADASRAIALSPAHPSILYGSGVLLALSGAWDSGVGCIREANRLNPLHPGYQHLYLALDRLKAGDDLGMLAEASLLTQPEDLWGPVIRCVGYIGLGHDELARQELDAALSIEPTLLDDDAVMIVEQFRDGPLEIRTTMRQRLRDWLAPPSPPARGRVTCPAGRSGAPPGSSGGAVA